MPRTCQVHQDLNNTDWSLYTGAISFAVLPGMFSRLANRKEIYWLGDGVWVWALPLSAPRGIVLSGEVPLEPTVNLALYSAFFGRMRGLQSRMGCENGDNRKIERKKHF